MKGTFELEFNLPEEQEEMQTAIDGSKWKSVVWEINNYLRNKIKYEEKEEFEPIREQLSQLISDSNLSLD